MVYSCPVDIGKISVSAPDMSAERMDKAGFYVRRPRPRLDSFAHEFGRIVGVSAAAVITAMKTLPSHERKGQPELFPMAAPKLHG